MEQVSQIVSFVLTYSLTALAFTVQQSIYLLNVSFANYPEATGMLVSVIFAYVAYKMLKQVIKMVYRMLLNTVKTFFYLFLVFIAGVVYLRGYQFFTKDIRDLYDFVTNIDYTLIADFEFSDENMRFFKESINNFVLMSRFFVKQLLRINDDN